MFISQPSLKVDKGSCRVRLQTQVVEDPPTHDFYLKFRLQWPFLMTKVVRELGKSNCRGITQRTFNPGD